MVRDREEENLYKINVQEIVDNWGGYSLKECDGAPAYNSGKLELKCFINNQCPFNKVDAVEDVLVFNENTIARVISDFPDKIYKSITTTSGVEGIHFKPRYVFRYNFIEQFEFVDFGFKLNTSTGSNIRQNFRDEYVIQQSWISVPSVFESGDTISAEWEDIKSTESDSNIKDIDLKNDLIESLYVEYIDSIEIDNKGNTTLKEGKKPVINPYEINIPIQVKTSEEFGSGVHWRLLKNTSLYRGEDFFIKFYKKARGNTVKKVSHYTPSFAGHAQFDYGALDVTQNKEKFYWGGDKPGFMGEQKVPLNAAVIGSKGEYDFSSQAYYIIELGYKKFFSSNYFIIITERGFPSFVVSEVGGDGVAFSRLLGKPFTEVSGKTLINADEFTMTVRNHLGKLVIEFKVPDREIKPWIIEKTERELETDKVTAEITEIRKPSMITVPRGRMTIWGGNLLCGFSFGPLQYSQPGLNIVYPPGPGKYPLLSTDYRDGRLVTEEKEAPEPALYLPSGVPHRIMFSNPIIDKDVLNEELSLKGEDIAFRGTSVPIFTQDAQFYDEWKEEYKIEKDEDNNDKVDGDGNPVFEIVGKVDDKYGAFYYKQTIKEIGYTAISDSPARTSGLAVRKYFSYDDPRTRKQAFNINILMVCGDHVFNNEWELKNDYSLPDTGNGKKYWKQNKGENGNEGSEWYIRDCKTPILTSIRLIAENLGKEPRWDDNTEIFEGVAKTPFDNNENNDEDPEDDSSDFNKYFVDATDHVLSYSDNWSATEFTQIDHTGTINFLLNQEQPFSNNYVVDKLYGLQDKTFYIEIWAGYRNCSYSRTNGFFKLFTGLCHGGVINYQYGKTIMSCKIVDYTSVLESQLFINSPFFDGMKDISVIDQILKMAGFRYKGVFDPGRLVNALNDSPDVDNNTTYNHIDGRIFKFQKYALPSGYNRLNQPMFKFDMGTNFLDGIREITKKSTKVFFFDQMGIAHYESIADLIKEDFRGIELLMSLYKFTTNPEIFPGQMIFKNIEHNYTVEEIRNYIKIISNTPDFHPLIFDYANWNSFDNPDMEGFMGYFKPFFQTEGLFGSKSATLDALIQYSLAFRPAVVYNFETYGLPLRANDIIDINGETARVMKVDHNLDPEKNEWWMTLECRRYLPVKSVGID